IPEMEVTLREQDGEETRTSVPISASDMRDEIPGGEKGKQVKEVVKKDSATAAPGSLEMKNKEKQSKQISNDTSKPSFKSKGKRGGTDSSLTQERTDSGSVAEKDNEKLTSTEKQKTPQVEKKQETKGKTDVGLFKSVHESLEVKDTPNGKKSSQKRIVEENNDPEVSTFRSVHLDENLDSAKKTKRISHENPTKNIIENPMFSSVHITDTIKSVPKVVFSKQDAKSRWTSGKTKSDSTKKSGKTAQGKPTAIKTAKKKQDSTKVSTRAKIKKTKVESNAVSVTKSKSSRKKVPVTKKETDNSTASRSFNSKNRSTSKSKQDTKPKKNTETLPKKQKTE
ncbi:MAG: hypothetical protein NZ763_09780, partial [Candidatus Marinimicrobia bacterium]|nr:hypothetical protein [Candidatus Neomarinimicrobiota bacterium]